MSTMMSQAVKNPKAVAVLRAIVGELRKAEPQIGDKSPQVSFCIDQLRQHQVTERRLCKGPKEIEHLGETYSCYLRSTRLLRELQSEYGGSGERSISDTAKLVGLSVSASTDMKPSSQ